MRSASSLPLLSLFLLTACGPVRSEVSDGTYQASASSPIGAATLVLETAAKTATVTLPSPGTPVMTQLTELPMAQWELGCPTNFSSVSVQTFTLTPDPLVLGSVSLGQPKLTAGCGLEGANADEVRLSGTGAGGAEVSVIFSRVAR